MLNVYIHFTDGTVRTIAYDCHTMNAFEALNRVYRSDDDFMIYEVDKVTFDQ